MNVGIIDLGTNTFNFLVAHIGPHGHWSSEFTCTIPVFLGKDSADTNNIQPDRMIRAMDAIHIHLKNATNYECDTILATGTAILRKASNADTFLKEVKKRFNIDIQIITGNTEAEFIFKGINIVTPNDEKCRLMMDIGGGSVEFVVFQKSKILWKASYEIGVSKLSSLRQYSDPLSTNDIASIETYFKEKAISLFDAINQFKPTEIVGSAGSFDTISATVSGFSLGFDLGTVRSINPDEFRKVLKLVLERKSVDRLQIPGMEPTRVQTLPLACILINTLLKQNHFKRIIRTSYSLREGIAHSIADGTFSATVKQNS